MFSKTLDRISAAATDTLGPGLDAVKNALYFIGAMCLMILLALVTR